MKRPHKIAVAVSAALGLGLAAAALAHPQERHEEVARKGATVMPFDLMRTTHFFDDTKSGGLETITAHDPSDKRQVALIRSHLAAEAKRFGNGDFSDPAAIHGHDMPGLAELARAGDKLQVGYKDLPGGARLGFTSRDASVIAAVHAWFAAQRSDHMAHEHFHE